MSSVYPSMICVVRRAGAYLGVRGWGCRADAIEFTDAEEAWGAAEWGRAGCSVVWEVYVPRFRVFVELVGALRLYLVGVGGVSSVRDDAEVFLDGEAAVAVSQAASEATGMEWHVEEQNERGFGLAGVRAFVVCDGGSWCDQLRMAGLVAYTEAVR